MATLTNPSEIARETLKQLMMRRVAPTPENYQAIYNEIAGIDDKGGRAEPEQDLKAELKSLLILLPKETAAQQRLSRQLDQSLKNGDLDAYRSTLVEFIAEHSAESELSWSDLIAELLRQWEAKQSGLTPGRKRESLDRVLSAGSKNSELLFSRLQNLTKSWAQNLAADDINLVEDAEVLPEMSSAIAVEAPPPPPSPLSRASELLPELRELFVFTLESMLVTQLDDAPDLVAEIKAIVTVIRRTTTLKAMQEAAATIKRLAYRLEFVCEDRNEVRSGLIKLLQLLIDNVNELIVDDRWLNGQIEMVREIVARPLNLRTLGDAEHRLKEVVFKQSQLKHSLQEAKEALKQMLAGFIDHLAEFADSTSDYHDKIEVCVQKISKADDISQLEGVLAEVIKETRVIQLNAQRSRDDLRSTKQRVDEAEKRINELQAELDKASALVRHDQLTGTLNRRGLEETFEQEMSRAQRRKSPLCISLLDIDNFKKLNDTLGHDAGDAALIHLVTVIRETLRPQDTLARFGGEEFVIVLPDTSVDDATKAMVRVQRQLTKRFFLANNEKVLITFSAGLTELRPGDTQATLTKRADDAMYIAKKSGKNRVMTA